MQPPVKAAGTTNVAGEDDWSGFQNGEVQQNEEIMTRGVPNGAVGGVVDPFAGS